MIHSMTGYGRAQHDEDGINYTLEIRTVNNRYLKLSLKLEERLQFAEPVVEKLLRDRLRRGSVVYTLRSSGSGEAGPSAMNLEVLQGYVDQLALVQLPDSLRGSVDLGALSSLPGVCRARVPDEQEQTRQLGIIEALSTRALDSVVQMRCQEGEAVYRDLSAACEAIRTHLGEVAERAPSVVEEYNARLKTRVATLLKAGGFELEEDGLMREVAIYAERCDISEELARISSHLQQFLELCDRGGQVGRTLDFLTQELLREANTIASKSSDAAIARSIVETKGWIDRLREQAQNVE